MLDKRQYIVFRIVVPLLQLLMLRTALCRALFVPLVNEGEVQILLAAGALGDDADAMEIGRGILDTVELAG